MKLTQDPRLIPSGQGRAVSPRSPQGSALGSCRVWAASQSSGQNEGWVPSSIVPDQPGPEAKGTPALPGGGRARGLGEMWVGGGDERRAWGTWATWATWGLRPIWSGDCGTQTEGRAGPGQQGVRSPASDHGLRVSDASRLCHLGRLLSLDPGPKRSWTREPRT